MSDHEMFLGELKAFRETTVKDLDEIKRELKLLNSFKLKIVGASMMFFGLVELLHLIK